MNILPVFTPVQAMMGTDLYDRLKAKGKLQDHIKNITNVPHHNITNRQIIDALAYIGQKGYGLTTNLKRTYFYSQLFRKQKSNTLNDIVHKTLFTFIMQQQFAKIVKEEIQRLKHKIQHLCTRTNRRNTILKYGHVATS